jgi:hypothetical protein
MHTDFGVNPKTETLGMNTVPRLLKFSTALHFISERAYLLQDIGHPKADPGRTFF